jgi:hypothetical protein
MRKPNRNDYVISLHLGEMRRPSKLASRIDRCIDHYIRDAYLVADHLTGSESERIIF